MEMWTAASLACLLQVLVKTWPHTTEIVGCFILPVEAGVAIAKQDSCSVVGTDGLQQDFQILLVIAKKQTAS